MSGSEAGGRSGPPAADLPPLELPMDPPRRRRRPRLSGRLVVYDPAAVERLLDPSRGGPAPACDFERWFDEEMRRALLYRRVEGRC